MTVQQILDTLSVHGFTKFADTLKVDYLNDVYFDICSRNPWPFLEASAAATTTLNTAAVSTGYPTDVSKVLGVALTDVTVSQPLEASKQEVLLERYTDLLTSTATAGIPAYYYFIANVMNLFPVPNAALGLSIRYLKRPIPLVASDVEATILLPPRHHRAIVAGTLNRLYKLDKAYDQADVMKMEYNERLTTMETDLMVRTLQPSDWMTLVDTEDIPDKIQ